MTVKLQLTGTATFSSPLTYSRFIRLNQIVKLSDADGVALLALTVKDPTTNVVSNIWTTYAGGATEDFDLSTMAVPKQFFDGSQVVLPAQLALLSTVPAKGTLLRDRDGLPYGYSDGAGGYTGNTRVGGDLLAVVKGLNFNVTTDQIIQLRYGIARYRPTKIVVTGASVSLSAGAGGIYTAAAKGGSAIVAAGQAYSALTAATKALNLTLAITDTVYTQDQLFFALTTARGVAATADLYLYGENLS